MDNQRFDIYLTGKLAVGLTPTEAVDRLAQLFRSTPEAMRVLVSGKPQIVKRGVDHATATKYRDALHRAGLEVSIRPQPEVETEPEAPQGLSLAPYGTEMLSAQERKPEITATIDTSHLSLQPQVFTPRFGPTDMPSAPEPLKTVTVDEGGLTLAPADGELLRPEEKTAPPSVMPVVPDLTLAEPGALLETLPVHTEFVLPDTSALTLAPSGTDLLLPSEIAPSKPVVVPDTSNLRLVD